jgi:hypothetical protein
MQLASIFSFRPLTWLSTLLLVCTANHCFADAASVRGSTACPLLTRPYSATYYGSFKGWRIDTVQELEARQDGQWRLSIHADNFLGAILEKSYFTVTPEGTIRSQQYNYEKKVLLNRRDISTVFDWSTRRATTTGDKTNTAPLVGGEFDNLNYLLAIRCDLMAGKTDMYYPTVDENGTDTLEFKTAGEEVLDTRLGKLDTIIVKRVRNNSNRSTTLWFAKNKDYLMVKLLQEEKKDAEAYLLYIDSLQPSPHP